MCPLYEGLPAIIYSGLWTLKLFRKLAKAFPKPIEITYLLIDTPPGFLVKIKDGNFDIEMLENVKNVEDLDKIQCDGYLALTTETLYKGPMAIREGIEQGSVKIKNMESITLIAKLTGGI
jgi:hypothetical protein